MNKRVIAVLVCTLLALIAATVWVPTYHGWQPQDNFADSHGPTATSITERAARIEYRWVWDRYEPNPFDAGRDGRDFDVYWPLLFAQQSLILLLGGGLLTFVVRRERRRKATA